MNRNAQRRISSFFGRSSLRVGVASLKNILKQLLFMGFIRYNGHGKFVTGGGCGPRVNGLKRTVKDSVFTLPDNEKFA